MPQQSTHLSPEKRALLEALLKQENLLDEETYTIHRREQSRSGATSAAEPAPLSFAQERLWFLYQLESNKATYNVPLCFRLKGILDADALEWSLNQVIQRHEVLRTSFRETEEGPRQIVSASLWVALEIIDLSNHPAEEREVEVQSLVAKACLQIFDLQRAPLLRAVLYRLEPGEQVLLFSIHHTIFDEWSAEILYRELEAFYRTRLNWSPGSPDVKPRLPQLLVQYADYAIWQRQQLQSAALVRQRAYWTKKLSGAPDTIDLPYDHPRPAVQTNRGTVLRRHLSGKFLDGLLRLRQQERVTIFTLLLSAFQILLYRYSGQTDLVIGTPIANRGLPEIENLIGFFLNTLALRGDLSGEPSFRQVIRRVQQTMLEALENQDLPFEQLVRDMKTSRDASRQPLFQVMFVWHPANLQKLALEGLLVEAVSLSFEWSKFDLTLTISERPDELIVSIEYNTDLFEAETIQRLLVHFDEMLIQLSENPDQPVGRLRMLSQAERSRLVEVLSRGQTRPLDLSTIVERFEQQAARTPDATAVLFEDQSLTYAELNTRANQLARYLRRQGMEPNALVGVYLQRSLEMVIALLGVLKAGGAYAPLDPANPPDRLAYILQDAGASIILSSAAFPLPRLPWQAQADMTRITLDSDWPLISREDGQNLPPQTGPENLAYVIYTSGSTGRPKGVMISHRALSTQLQWAREAFTWKAEDRMLQSSVFGFDVSVWEFFAPLQVGAQLVMARPDGQRDAEYLVEIIQRYHITTLQGVPTLVNLLAETPGLKDCRSLRRILCAGEALPDELVRRVLAALDSPNFTLYNLYGPTEACIYATAWAALPGQPLRVSIGRPLDNYQTYILDQNLEPVPQGLVGELYLGGPGLANGYLNRPDLTAERFIPNPFVNSDRQFEQRLYRTGDQVCFLPDGKIDFLGRLDSQVKLRGFRIELGEIDAALLEIPGVLQAATLLCEDEPGEKRLVAYMTLSPDGDLHAASLRKALKVRLPEFMIPAAFVSLDKLPLNPSGKIDRLALRSIPVETHTLLPGEASQPIDDKSPTLLGLVEHRVGEIWSRVLKLQTVSRDDNFFEIGGHSLLATQVISRLRTVFQIDLPLHSIFEHPTVTGLAEEIEARLQTASHPHPSEPVDDTGDDREEFVL